MKKLLAYLSILFAVILGCVAFAKPAVVRINGGIDYDGGKEMVFQILNEGETIDDFTEISDEKAILNVADEFSNRFEKYGVNKYDIAVEGNDKIRVRFSALDSVDYDYVSRLLVFDGHLSLVTYDGSVVFNNYDNGPYATDEKAMFGEKDAYLTYKNQIFPGVVIPLTDPEKFQEQAVKHAEDLHNESGTHEHEEGEESESSDQGNIYLWSNYDPETDSFETASNNENIKEKLIMAFSHSNIWFEEKEEDHASIAYFVNVEGVDENTDASTINWANVSKATAQAKFLLQCINASHYDYKVVKLYEKTIDANIEQLVINDMSQSAAASKLFIATIVLFAVVLVVGTMLYKLSGLSVAITSIFGIIATLFLYTALNATLTFPAVLGFITAAILIVTSSVMHPHKLMIELNKNKSMRKAYLDSTKKVNWYSLDISVIGAIAGIIVYLASNSYISGFGIMLFFGAIFNLIIQFVINKPLMSFLTGSVGETKPQLMTRLNGVKPVEAPAEVAEEAENNQPKIKHLGSKIFGIVMALLAVGFTLALSINSAIATPYNEKSNFNNYSYSYIYVERTSTGTVYNTPESVEEVLDLIKYQENDNSEYVNVYTSVESKEYTGYTNPDDAKQSIKFNYFVYEVKLNEKLDPLASNYHVVTIAKEGDKDIISKTTISGTLEDCLKAQFGENISLTVNKAQTRALTATYDIAPIALATFVSIGIITIYFVVRYKFAAALLGFGSACVMTLITLGLFAVVRTPVYSYVAYATLPIAIITLVLYAVLSIKYREGLKDNLNKNPDAAFKRQVLERNKLEIKDIAAVTAFISIIISFIYLASSGSGVPLTVNTYLLLTFMSILVFILSNTFIPFMSTLVGHQRKIKDKNTPKSNKKRLKRQHAARQRGKEVEEATFIGIND